MKGREDPVKAAIEKPNPLIIYQDRDFPNRHIYYSIWASRPRYIKVVVEFVDNQNGEVITAFMSDNPKAGEHILWTR